MRVQHEISPDFYESHARQGTLIFAQQISGSQKAT
jgi:hypothetical protein